MSALGITAVLAAGVAAGLINAVVGSGSLLTFPVLLAVGYPPLVANMSNSVGLVPGNISGAYGYRHELGGQWSRVFTFGAISVVGSAVGAALLLKLPPGVFTAVVPWLVLAAGLLVLFQPMLRRALDNRVSAEPGADRTVPMYLGVFGCSVYGGYFGAAQGIILLALLGLFVADGIQRLNAVKNICAGISNGVAAAIFIVIGHVAWLPAILLGIGSMIGGQVGAKIGRRLHPNALRACIVVVSFVVFAVMMLN